MRTALLAVRLRPPFRVRAISFAVPRCSEDTPKSKAKRTRRKASDLPEVALSRSGEPAAPLEEWNGGLTGRTKKTTLMTSDEPENETSKKTRTLRKSRAKKASEPPNKDNTLPKTELALEIIRNLERFPHCLLLTRVGQFYESYFDQSMEIAKLLNIKLTSKSWGGNRVPMCGFPLMHLEKYLKVLIRGHRRSVALCEEFKRENDRFERRVTRIVTPGTLIDETFLNPYENNYVLSVSCLPGTTSEQSTIGLAWMDVSTGEFFSQESPLATLHDEIVRIAPKEIVLSEKMRNLPAHPVCQAIAEEQNLFVSYIRGREASIALQEAEEPNSDDLTLPAPIFPTYASDEAEAISQLTTYLTENLLDHMPTLSRPVRQGTDMRMQIDGHTIRSLEIVEGMREGGTVGTLLSVINRTTTSSGSRLLSRWICAPSTSIAEIKTRQRVVSFFYARPHLRTDLIGLLRKIEDTARIVQKFLAGRGTPDDLRNIAAAITIWEEFRERITLERQMEPIEQGRLLNWETIDSLLSNMVSLKALSLKINAAVAPAEDTEIGENESEEPLDPMAIPTTPRPNSFGIYKWFINPSYSLALQSLHGQLEELRKEKENLELAYQAKYFANSLTLRISPQLGFHVHARKKEASKLTADKAEFTSLSESGTTKTFFNQRWLKLGNSLMETAGMIMELERDAFKELREAVTKESRNIRRNARVIDEMDVTIGFAELAVQHNFVQPVVTEDTEYHVVNGRHPTVEVGLLGSGRLFMPNSVHLDPSSRLHIITGPNMAGKSTLLRQTALLSILAQIGSFVPADSARIGIVDRLFSRIGANDDLFRDRSTFLVEMLETAEILNRSTAKSLVIMDEVGRGTAVSTALAIAFATIHHLYARNQCRGLFATHFHEVTDMLGYNEQTRKAEGFFKDIAFFCTSVDELDDGAFSYSHRLKPGVNRDSHGLKVARMGGMPPSALDVATHALGHLIGNNKKSLIARSEELRALGDKLASL
ncbi:DNA mismatch repair ATPase msh1 [Serendipita sp. 400]|nr:DNA mismatch repair ATPase msh1 [Serendipita sp. 400]